MAPRVSRLVVLLAFCACCAALPAGALEASPGDTLFSPWRTLRVGAETRPAAGAVFEKGRIRVEFASGSFVRVENGAGEFAGWLFHGEGRWVYRVEDPLDRFAVRENLRQVAPAMTLDHWTLRGRFDECLLLFARPEEGVLRRHAAADPGAAPVRAPDHAAERLARLSGLPHDAALLRLEHRAVAARVDGEDQWILLVFRGGRYPFDWVWNRADGWHEELCVRRRAQSAPWHWWDSISDQALPGTDGRTPARYVVRRVEIDAESPDNHRIRVVTDLSLDILAPGLRVLRMSLLSDRDPDWTRVDGERNVLHVRRVVDGEGKELAWYHRFGTISIDLGRRYRSGERIHLHVETEGDFFTDASRKLADNYRYFLGDAWFPRGVLLGENRFTYRVRVRTRHPFVPVVSGDTVSSRRDGDMHEVVSESRVPAWYVALFAGKYLPVEVREGDLVVRAWRYARGRKKDAERLARVTLMFARIYEEMLGKLPWRELDVVESPDYGYYGVSPHGLILTTSRTFKSATPEAKRLWTRGLNLMVAHEVAHQWFGHLAWERDWFRDNWLSESFAEYVSALAMEIAVRAAEKQGTAPRGVVTRFPTRLEEWRGRARMVAGKGTILGANYLGGDLAWDYRLELLYDRGPLVLHGFRTLVGEERFLRTLREYLAAADHGPVTTDDFLAAARAATGMDWDWYFDEWLKKPWIPEVDVSWRMSPGKSGAVVVSGTLRQDPEKFMKIHVPFVAFFASGRPMVRLVLQERPEQEFRFELPRRPRKIEVDPGKNTFARWKVHRDGR